MKSDVRPIAGVVPLDPDFDQRPPSRPVKPEISTEAAAADAAPTELRLAGPVCLVAGGRQPVRLASAQAQAAVARLVLDRHGNGTTREQLADVIWPEGLPDTWASAMRSVVSRIRRFLASSGVAGADLTSHGGRYFLQLPAGIAVDIEEAENQLAGAADVTDESGALGSLREAENAVRCFRRPFLANREGDWAAHVREHLSGRANEGLEVASRAALMANEIGAAISHSTELIGRAPLRESAYRTLMTAYQAVGNRGDALATYSSLRSQLRDELGVDPSTETQQLYYEVLGLVPGAAVAPLQRARRRRPFIGRGLIMEALDEAQRASRAGSVQMVLLTGELGIGKSRVLHEFGRQLSHSEEVVVPVQCQAYPVKRCALASSLADVAAAAGPDSGLAAIRRRLDQVLADCTREQLPGAATGNAALALAELILDVARRTATTLILDDVDTADGITQDVLRNLIFHSGPPAQLTLVAAATSPRSAAGFVRHLHELPQPNSFRVIELEPFTPYEVHQLVSGLPDVGSGRQPGIGELMDRSGGNPFLLSELLPTTGAVTDSATETGTGPGDAVSLPVLDYVHARLAGLDADATALLSYAAASGQLIDFEVVANAAGRHGITAATIGALVRCGLLEEANSPASRQGAQAGRETHHRFRHGLVREAIYAGLSTTERFEIHSRLFSAFREVKPPHASMGLPELAGQLLARQFLGTDGQSSRLVETVQACREAAAAAAQRGQVTEAIRRYQQALELVSGHHPGLRARTLAELGRLEAAHALPEGIDHLRDGALLALQAGSIGVAMDAAGELVDNFAGVPHLHGEAVALTDLVTNELLSLAADQLEPDDVGAALGRFLARAGSLGARRPTPGLIRRAIAALTIQLERSGAPSRLTDRATAAEDLWCLASATEHPDGRVLAAEHRVAAAAIHGHATAFADWSARLECAVQEHPDAGAFQYLLDGLTLMTQVSSGSALWTPDGAGHLPTPGGRAVRVGGAERGSSAMRGGRGESPDAPGPGRQLLVGRWIRSAFSPESHPAVPGLRSGQSTAGAQPGQGYRADQCLEDVLNGQLGTARLRLRGMLLEPLGAPHNDAELHSLGIMAITAAELEDAVASRQLFELLSPLRNLLVCHGIHSFAGSVSFHLARLARIGHDLDEAEELVTSSVNTLSAISARPWVALAQHELALILRDRGRPADARLIEALLVEARQLVRGSRGLAAAPKPN
ncbi:BTAD domain-containing putative transcriptional regulator [Arthrobacter sp. MDT3-24]